MNKITSILVAGALTTALVGCTDSYYNPSTGTVVGGVAGGVGGGVVGYQVGGGVGAVVGAIGGTLLGAFIGNQLGYNLDQPTMYACNNAFQRAMDTGRTISWNTPRSHGYINPGRTFTDGTGRLCRTFTTKVVVYHYDRKVTRTFHGTACKNSRGMWVVQ